MAARCISSGCVDAGAPVRATFINLYKWPESDAEFVKSVSRGRCPRVVESYCCRQMYLRSYTFTRKETVNEKTRKCIARVQEKMVPQGRKRGKEGGKSKKCVMMRKVREMTSSFFHSLLSCTTSVDVVLDGKNY